MKDYQHFSVNDFVADEYFQSWVLNPDEKTEAFWNTWRSGHPEKIRETEEARKLLESLTASRYVLSPENVSHLWARIQDNEDQLPGQQQAISSNPYRWYWAAAAVLLIGVSLVFLIGKEKHVEYRTAFGETRTIKLPDSSTVILNANSHITIVNDWSTEPVREVLLEGEAYFSVIHKHNHQPFSVRVKDGVAVEVLGTTFNVYHRTADTKVVLNSGQIRLNLPSAGPARKIVMKPGELVEYTQDNYSKRTVNPSVYVAWTEKKIILDHTTLRDMVRMVKDNYGVDVAVQSEAMLDQTVSGSMPVGDAESLVYQIARTFQLKIVKDDDSFMLRE